MDKRHTPTFLFRDMSAEEVEEFWIWLYEQAETQERRAQALTTSDGQGVRWMCREEFDAAVFTKQALYLARHKFVEMLSNPQGV